MCEKRPLRDHKDADNRYDHRKGKHNNIWYMFPVHNNSSGFEPASFFNLIISTCFWIIPYKGAISGLPSQDIYGNRESYNERQGNGKIKQGSGKEFYAGLQANARVEVRRNLINFFYR